MDRSICIHGHFYQPPRENAWLEAIELQDSAHPYHDWNERITAECYAPNSASRIVDHEGRIRKITNNYAKISFNFGPTLLSWMEIKVPEIYRAVLESDRESRDLYQGHGSAIAQAYNHMILPLANRRDKVTQVLWGITDFEFRFGRKPEGMWLPETAVDLETLDVLAECGIRFAILAPHQAKRFKPAEAEQWQDTAGGNIDTTRVYLHRLPSEKDIALFFYNNALTKEIAFGGMLEKGENLARALVGALSGDVSRSRVVHVATDGETYGHHHPHGDIALAYALCSIGAEKDAQLTNYSAYLHANPPDHLVEIIENTSWSCIHGIERWRGNCGCNTGGHPGWNQEWRKPMRESLDWLRDTLAPVYEKKAAAFLKDPWQARNDYIRVILDRSDESLEAFLSRQASRPLDDGEKVTVLKLLELQRHALLMYTSCGWFFDELSGIETMQVLQYACRVLQLAEEVLDSRLEEEFLRRLEAAKSNIPEQGDGRTIYGRYITPARVDLLKVCAHFAVSSIFESYTDRTSIFCYTVDVEDRRNFEAGSTKLLLGRALVASTITRESSRITFGVLHFGDHTLNCGVRDFQGEESYQQMLAEVSAPFQQADFPETLRMMDSHFGESTYSLKSLFRDEQRKVVDLLFNAYLERAQAAYREMHRQHVPMMRFLKTLNIPVPRHLFVAAEFALNDGLLSLLQKEDFEIEPIRNFLEESLALGIPLDRETLEHAFRMNIEQMAEAFHARPYEIDPLQKMEAAMGIVKEIPFEVNLWKVQNIIFGLLKNVFPGMQEKAGRGDAEAGRWVEEFRSLCDKLSLRVA
jgi:alpha-amylase/alpha-mannosidase (GH57 family)